MAVYVRKDRFYKKAKADGWRSRAVFKLIEIDQKFKIFKSGSHIVDLGCYPGGWIQVALQRIGPSGKLVGIDLEEVVPFGQKNVVILRGDLRKSEDRERVISALGRKADLVLSDMAPNLSGIRFKDYFESYELADLALQTCEAALRTGGDFVVKIFPGEELEQFKARMKQSFDQIKIFIPDATRKTSTEIYLVGKGFKQIKTAGP